MKKHIPLTRSCVVCGLEKPLSAFLQITGKQGTHYGTICSTCRGAGLTEKKKVLEDEQGAASSGMRIGAKQRVEMEKQQKRDRQEIQAHHDEKKQKREHVALEKIETQDEKELALKRREQKQSFLNYQTKPLQPLSVQSMLHQKKDERLFVSTDLPIEKKQAVAVAKAEAAKQEKQKKTVDLRGGPVIDSQHNVVSRDNPTFRKFLTWLGADAPMMKTLSQLNKTSSPFQKPTIEQIESNPEEAARELVDKTWGPSSRKR